MWIVGILFVVVSVGIAVLLVAALRPVVTRLAGDEHNSVLGNAFAAVATLFAIVAGLLVFAVVGAFAAASTACSQEAAGLTQMYRNVQIFPQPQRSQAGEVIKAYTLSVQEDEFPTMARGQRSPETGKAMDDMFNVIGNMTPDKSWSDQYTVVAQKMTDIVALREARIESSAPVLSPIYLIVLSISAIVTLACLALIHTENSLTHMLAVGLVASVLGLVMFLMVQLNSPYNGEISVGPSSFDNTLLTIERISGTG
jgi:hypothetical protein